jgi:hypothetical protein
MKIKLSVLIACVFLTQAVFAQFHFGIKGGANFTKIDGKAFSQEFQYGYHLGGFAEIGLGKLTIQPEVLFNQVQSRVDSSFKDVYQNALSFSNYHDVTLHYLSIPIMLNYNFDKFFALQAGPQFGILMNQDKSLVQNGKDAFKNGDFSLAGGAQLHIAMFRITGRYVVGLYNINDIGNQSKWKNQGFQLSLGIAL